MKEIIELGGNYLFNTTGDFNLIHDTDILLSDTDTSN